MLKRARHAVQTSVLAGQRAAGRAGVQEGGFRGTFSFIDQLRDMLSKVRARGRMRLNPTWFEKSLILLGFQVLRTPLHRDFFHSLTATTRVASRSRTRVAPVPDASNSAAAS